MLRNFLSFVEIKFFKFGSLIYKEGQVLEDIYFIKNGEIEISKLINKDYEDLIPNANNIEEAREQTEILQKKKLAIVNRVWSAQNSKKCNKRFTVISKILFFSFKLCSSYFFFQIYKRLKINKLLYKISILGPNQFFGNDDQEGHNMEARATVKSELAELYIVSKSKINEICSEYGIENEFGEIAKLKDDWHRKLQEKINVFIDFANKIAPSIPKINKPSPNNAIEDTNKYGNK